MTQSQKTLIETLIRASNRVYSHASSISSGDYIVTSPSISKIIDGIFTSERRKNKIKRLLDESI